MPQEISISIALVTRNRPESLRRCLRSWRAQSVQPFEIVISDDSDDAHREEVRNIAHEFGARPVDGPRRGLYANRNHVARECFGTHIFSADDDHEHPAGLLEICLDAIRSDPHSAWCLGEVAAWKDIPNGWYLPSELSVVGGSRIPKDLTNCRAWSDGATIFPREIIDKRLHFSEAFRFGGSYLEFGCLLNSVGQRIRILDSTGVIHHFGQADRSFQIPIEEKASWYFAKLMLALVYQPTKKNRSLIFFYFLKEIMRNPLILSKALPAALQAKRERARWFHEWHSNN